MKRNNVLPIHLTFYFSKTIELSLGFSCKNSKYFIFVKPVRKCFEENTLQKLRATEEEGPCSYRLKEANSASDMTKQGNEPPLQPRAPELDF